MMLVPLAILATLAVVISADPAINEARPHSNRPGRFLSLPVPAKCANRECNFFVIIPNSIILISLKFLWKYEIWR